MSHFAYSIQVFVGKLAAKNPERFVYAALLVGMCLGIATHAWLGGLLGSAVGHPTAGVWTGLSFYGYTFAINVERLKGNTEERIALLKQIASQL